MLLLSLNKQYNTHRMTKLIEHDQLTIAPQNFWTSMDELLIYEWWKFFQLQCFNKNDAAAISIWSDIPEGHMFLPTSDKVCKGAKMCLIILKMTFEMIIEKSQPLFSPHYFVSVIEILNMSNDEIFKTAQKVVQNRIDNTDGEQKSMQMDNEIIINGDDFEHFEKHDHIKLKELFNNFREFVLTNWIPRSYVSVYIYCYFFDEYNT